MLCVGHDTGDRRQDRSFESIKIYSNTYRQSTGVESELLKNISTNRYTYRH